MAWIESHQALRNHRKTRRLMKALSIDQPAALGHLHMMWWWAIDSAPSGNLTGLEDWEIANGAEWNGAADEFRNALRYAGFIDARNRLNDWHDYFGKYAKARRTNAQRQARFRNALRNGDKGVTSRVTSRSNNALEERRVEDSTKNKEPSDGTDASRLAVMLADGIEANGARRPTVTQAWLRDMRLLLTADGISPSDAEDVIVWTLADPFWSTNILSAGKLRKQFDALRLRMRREADGGASVDRRLEREIADLRKAEAS